MSGEPLEADDRIRFCVHSSDMVGSSLLGLADVEVEDVINSEEGVYSQVLPLLNSKGEEDKARGNLHVLIAFGDAKLPEIQLPAGARARGNTLPSRNSEIGKNAMSSDDIEVAQTVSKSGSVSTKKKKKKKNSIVEESLADKDDSSSSSKGSEKGGHKRKKSFGRKSGDENNTKKSGEVKTKKETHKRKKSSEQKSGELIPPDKEPKVKTPPKAEEKKEREGEHILLRVCAARRLKPVDEDDDEEDESNYPDPMVKLGRKGGDAKKQKTDAQKKVIFISFAFPFSFL